jgi:hypothetical protein
LVLYPSKKKEKEKKDGQMADLRQAKKATKR